MEPNHYIETVTVLNADADFRSLLKPSALLRYVEQVSADHARAFGMDDAFFREQGVAFLVGKQALQFTRVPRRTETLTLTTRAEESRRGSIKRITTVTDASGAQVAMVDCRWIVVSLAEGRILRRDGLIRAGEWTAHYSQCDLNGHINNAFYLDIACDALPLDVLKQGPVKFASVNYHREVPLGGKLEVLYAPSAEGWYLIGRHDGQTSFQCYLELDTEN